MKSSALSGPVGKSLLIPVLTMIAGGAAGALLVTTLITDPDNGPVQEMNTAQMQETTATDDTVVAAAPPTETEEAVTTEILEKEADVAVAAYVAPAAQNLNELTKTVSVSKGDTLMKVLTRAGADRTESYEAITALNEIFDPRSLKIGQDITLYFGIDEARESDDTAPSLIRVSLNEDVDRQLAAVRTPGEGFTAQETILELDRKMVRAGGIIQSSLFLSAAQAGIPTKTIVDLIRIFSYDVDFQREIQPGDSFEVYFERFADESGNILKEGSILWASMTLSGKEFSVYRYKTDDDGFTDYYDEKGRSVKKTLMRTPIDGARLTSGFGKRKHPTLGYTKMHRGVDFGARSGTPIMAAGNGTVEFAARNGGYGNYVRIRHNNEFKTAYAHMRKFAKGIRKGARVKQGQIIGYVGSTGRSTGPHLHYEVHKGGRQINPLSVKLPAGRKLDGKMLAAFKSHSDQIRQEIASVELETQLASAKTD
ncbi:peptidoglycan DD-metalloendopeptidase family protein [Sneathiella sp. CAU 1612]|uniref:Peptidoglycan DD-metalloendopeptidase family protein n=1 Tax=Sneathiella sedimenti TaxID=2816034 RepID=A0ABS3F0V0_9PROT|nr:peptidoglycan DD-metalloendopeptidase family protein [Sneathiella sedimenti]MBO0331973.1 peptidoglycan DD-metalloendopeptidase family protein [Sneathiella sedimenti]